MLKLLLILCVAVFCGGCAKLEHLQELLTLKDMSDEQDRLDRYVKEQDKKFEELIAAVKSESIKNYSNNKIILKAFGEPIMREKITQNGQEMESWLYRYAKIYFGSEKVYLQFNPSGELVSWEYVPAQN